MARRWLVSEHDANRVIKLTFRCNYGHRQIIQAMPHVTRHQITRLVRHFKRTGCIPYAGYKNPGAGLSEREMSLLNAMLELDPTLYLDELAVKLFRVTGKFKDETQICRALQKMGLTVKMVC